jgi:hypothetical protein
VQTTRTRKGSAPTTGLAQKGEQRVGPAGLRRKDDVPALAPRGQQPDLLQRAKMRRERVVRHRQQAADIAGGEPMRPVAHQEPEDLEPRRLRERGEQRDCVRRIEALRHAAWSCGAMSLRVWSFPIVSRCCFSAMPRSVASGRLEKTEMRLCSMR